MKKYFVLLLILVIFTTPLQAQAQQADAQKAVLITGASTGLGRAMAELLASEGHLSMPVHARTKTWPS